jgi:hypothetical protein
VPVRISARSLGPLRNAATVTSCKYPATLARQFMLALSRQAIRIEKIKY